MYVEEEFSNRVFDYLNFCAKKTAYKDGLFRECIFADTHYLPDINLIGRLRTQTTGLMMMCQTTNAEMTKNIFTHFQSAHKKQKIIENIGLPPDYYICGISAKFLPTAPRD